MGSAYQFHSWRVFVLVCAFPCVAAIAALNSMPESPRFYLEVSGCSAGGGPVSRELIDFFVYLFICLFHLERQTRRRLDDSEASSRHQHASKGIPGEGVFCE